MSLTLEPGRRFHDTQPAPIEELSDHLGGSVHERNNGGDFFAGHDNGDGDLLVGANGIDTARQSMVEDALVEEHQSIHRPGSRSRERRFRSRPSPSGMLRS